MHNKSKSRHLNPPPKLQICQKYINSITYRNKNFVNTKLQNQQYPLLSLSHLDKIVPTIYTNRGIISERKQKNQANFQLNRKHIKQKIKDRIKAEIQNIVQRSTSKFNKLQNNNKQTKQFDPEENVSIIGLSVPRLVCYNSLIKQKQLKKQNSTLNIRIQKSSIFTQLERSHKVRSSLGLRSELQKLDLKVKNSKESMYRRSMSTNIRIFNIAKGKSSFAQIGSKAEKNKDQTIQPWVIGNFVEDQQIF